MLSEIERTRVRMATTVLKYIDTPETLYNIGVGPLSKSEWKHIKDKEPSIEIFGCEPNPPLFLELLPQFNGRLLNVGISDKPSIALHVADGLDAFGRSSIFPVSGMDKTVEVPCMTLDEFDRRAGEPSNIILWMDIEGSELIALKSGKELLESGRVSVINLEVRATSEIEEWPTSDEIAEYLESVGYPLTITYNDHGTHRDAIYQRKTK